MIGMIVIFFGVVISDFFFLGVVQAKSFKKIKLVKINSGLLVFFRLIFDQEVYFRVHKFYDLVIFRVVL